MADFIGKPLISVIMPVYNGAVFVGEAIESVMAQTYQSFEFIIVNDGSTDSTGEIIEYYRKLYPHKIRVSKLLKKGGAFAAINSVYKEAKGEFIALMDSDDISLPARFEKQIKILMDDPEIIVLGSQALIIDKDGKTIGRKNLPLEPQDIKKEYAFSHPMVHPSCILRRKFLSEKNYIYENKYGVNDDYYTFFKLLNYGKFANTGEILYKYRIHFDNSSLKNLKKTLRNTIKIRLAAWKNYGYELPLPAFLMMFVQFVVFSLVPNKIVLNLYLWLRGIYSFADIRNRIFVRLQEIFIKPVFLLLYKQE